MSDGCLKDVWKLPGGCLNLRVSGGKEEYHQLLAHTLPALQELDYDDLLPGAASLLFHTMNHILTTAACPTNKVLDLSKPPKKKTSPRLPTIVSAAMKSKEFN